ncbi:MAG: hypothetical protein ACP5VR_13115 [Acidimicrobiales bacterium]
MSGQPRRPRHYHVPTELGTKWGQRVLVGLRPSEGQRRLVLSNPEVVPEALGYLANDVVASRGVGVYELGGVPSALV